MRAGKQSRPAGQAGNKQRKQSARRPAQPHSALAKLAIAQREYKEALEQQAATAQILRALSRSPADPKPIFDAIVENAHRLCGAVYSVLYRYDGEMISILADKQVHRKAMRTLRSIYPEAPRRDKFVGRSILEGRTMHSADITHDSRFPGNRNAFSRAIGRRAAVSVPLLHDGRVLGAIACGRPEAKAFTRKEIYLLKTFADQAVIAIENARLFNETKEALEHQKASADILRIVAGSVESTDPVFEAITAAGMRLIPNSRAALLLVHDGQMHYVSHSGVSAERRADVAKYFPLPLTGPRTVASTAILEKRVLHVPDIRAVAKNFPLAKKMARASGFQAILSVPLLREGQAIGAISVSREQPGAFTDKQVELVRTFADQAVIAIENARLFNETKEALEQQTATAEILKVISGSPTETQPVFEAIVQSAARLFPPCNVSIVMREGDGLYRKAYAGPRASQIDQERLAKIYPLPLDPDRSMAARAMLERRIIEIPDSETPGLPAVVKSVGQAAGFRSLTVVPLLREGQGIGAIGLNHPQPGFRLTEKQLALVRTFADQAVIAIENARMFREIQERNAELKQSLDFQGASGEILASISSSVTDAKPVFDAIVKSLLRLFGTRYATITLLRDGQHHLAALHGEPGYEWLATTYPRPLSDRSLAGRAILSGQVLQVAPVLGNPAAPPGTAEVARKVGFNSIIAAPMIREGKVIGSITTAHRDARSFDAKQVALIKAFADQAVIAIENARLFNETKEALERQTATAEILKVISSSPTDTQPVFDAILERATKLCNAETGILFRYVEGAFHTLAKRVHDPAFAELFKQPRRPTPGSKTGLGRLMRERRAVHIPDIRKDEAYTEQDPMRLETVAGGMRAWLGAPMLRDGDLVGAIVIYRTEPRPFSEQQVSLLQTFADQAVIAIANVRLFNETREALERQTATGEILRVIAGTPADAQPVFDAIAQSALRLFGVSHVGITLREGDSIRSKATAGSADPRGEFLIPLDRDSTAGRCMLDKTVISIGDTEAPDAPGFARESGRVVGFRAIAAAPMLREGTAIGSVHMMRKSPGPFSDAQIDLLKAFADQAVIAIENARLFNETKEALERQTATANILEVISRSATDVQPVFDTVAENAVRLCDASFSIVTRFDGELIHVASICNLRPGAADAIRSAFPARPSRRGADSRAILDRAVVHIPELRDDPEYSPGGLADATGVRSSLAVPMLRGGSPLGSIGVARSEPRPFTEQQIALLKTFADQAAIAIENVRLFNETKEALEQQTATAEILKVIASSPSDVQPVFDIIAERAVALCGGEVSVVSRFDGTSLQQAAIHGITRAGVEALRGVFPMRLDAETLTTRAFRARSVVHIADVLADPRYEQKGTAVAAGWRSGLAVPMLRGTEVIGVIFAGRSTVGLFTESQVELLKTFADQAVIAIENVRLFNETKEALERQKASAEILRVISGSLEDTSPVFEAIVAAGARLYEAHQVGINVLGADGRVTLRAYHGPNREEFEAYMTGESRQAAGGGLRLKRRLAHFPDVEAGPDVPEQIRGGCRITGTKAIIYAPMVSGGKGIGALWVGRDRVGRFSDKEIALLQTFADQAVIAIQNARLFGDTKEALERQTATAEILKVIASSPADVQPVFDTIAANAVRLADAQGAVFRFDGERVDVVALGNVTPEADAAIRKAYPQALSRGNATARAILARSIVHIADVRDDPDYAMGGLAKAANYRSILSVPMLRAGEPVGAITVTRVQPTGFPEQQIAMLKTFADQAVIAIENVRLFNETKEALERQTATAEILRVISSSPADIQPVLDAVASTAARLCGASDAVIRRVDGDVLRLAAKYGAILADSEARPIDRGSASGRAVLERQTIHICDVLDDAELSFTREMARRHGFRTVLSTPLLREGQPIGTISIRRPEARLFSDSEVKLLKAFADQAVIAIENVRLFKELEARTEALTKSVGQLTALGEVGQAISSTLDLAAVLKTIVSRAVQLTGLDGGTIYEYDGRGEEFHLRASENMPDELAEVYRRMPIRLGEGIVGSAAAKREPVQVPDIQDPSYQTRYRDMLIEQGYRAILAVPLLREEQIIGALTVSRNKPGAFPPEVVELLKTFATQSALAIQNARLFREIAEKGRQLEVASRHKSDFLASMSHELRTPLNALLGFNEMILGDVYGEVPGDMKPPLAQMQSSGKHLLRLINNVLDLAKIEAGRMELALSDYSVQDTVESVRSTLKPLAADKGLEFLTAVPADIPLAYGDPGRITQCLMNLAGNSLKFTKAGKVEISVALNDGWLRYRVADTGIGIPPEKIASLFTEFKQTDATIASEYGGTGLGLSISKKFVEMHGGRIWVESEPGKGSTFIFEIPLRAKTT